MLELIVVELLALVVPVLAGEDGERSEPPAAGAAEGRLDVVEELLTVCE